MAITEFHASHIGRVSVEYSLSGPNLDPDGLTALIGVTPSQVFRRGEPRLNHAKDQVGVHQEGYWGFSSEGQVASKDVNDHFDVVLNALLPHVGHLRTRAAEGEAFFSVFWESSYLYAGTGPLLSERAVAGVAALGAGMGFDIYQINDDVV